MLKPLRVITLVVTTTALVVLVQIPDVHSQQETKGKSRESGDASAKEKTDPSVSLNPAVFLLRDPLVQTELKLNPAQKSAVLELAAEMNELIWRFRDVPPGSGIGADQMQQINDKVEARLKQNLTSQQQERLDQIVLRLQGPSVLLQPKVAQRLAVTEEQKNKLNKIATDHQTAMKDIRLLAAAGKNVSELPRKADKLNADLRKDLLAALTPAQRTRWNLLQGKPFDGSKLRPLTADAPELRDVDAWINSEPLTFEQLRGQVVALHFWTFG